MKKQKWLCEKCTKLGSVNYKKGEDILTIARRVEDDHGKISPRCRLPIGKIILVK